MLGNNNPVYNFFYERIILFKAFRNTAKFLPILIFLLFYVIFRILIKIDSKKIKVIIFLLLCTSLIYNAPYITYSKNFYSKRKIFKIPNYWIKMSNYINTKTNSNLTILILPAIYSTENYYWNNNYSFISGHIGDELLNIRSYRLSEGFTGDDKLRLEMKNLFVPSDFSLRKKDIDYKLLSNFVKKYSFDYVLVTKDISSEYQNIEGIKKWLVDNNYNKVTTFDKLDLYYNPQFFSKYIDSKNLIYKKIDNFKYLLSVNIQNKQELTLLEPYHEGWSIYINKFHDIANHNYPIFNITDIFLLFKNRLFDSTHKIFNDYSNYWVLDPDYIRKNYPKSYYRENPDGSMDVELTLYFRPQSYFYLGLIISGTTLLGCIGYLVFDIIRIRRKHHTQHHTTKHHTSHTRCVMFANLEFNLPQTNYQDTP